MAVSNSEVQRIVQSVIKTMGLDSEASQMLQGWAGRWEKDFTTKSEYTSRAVTTMTTNAAGHYKTMKRESYVGWADGPFKPLEHLLEAEELRPCAECGAPVPERINNVKTGPGLCKLCGSPTKKTVKEAFGNLGLHIIKNPAGTYSFVGSVPRNLGNEVAANTADIMAGRAYKNAAGESVTTKFPIFKTGAEAVAHAKARGYDAKLNESINEAEKITLKCNECGRKFKVSPNNPDPICPKCGGADYDVLNEAEFKRIGQPLASLTTRVNRVNTYLADDVGRKYHAQIPLDDIFAKLDENGLEPLQEDDTRWSGMLLGRDGKMNVPLRDAATGKKSKYLSLSWHKMDVTGNFEVTAYVS